MLLLSKMGHDFYWDGGKIMSIKEFFKYLENKDIETQIVYLRYRYSWEDDWIYSNQILEVDMSVDGFYIWNSDWNEGQEDVEVLGCIAVSDVEVPLFEEVYYDISRFL